MSDAPKPRSDAVMKAIQHAIDEAKIAYAFRAGSLHHVSTQRRAGRRASLSARGGPGSAVSRSSPRHHKQRPNHQPSEDTMTAANDNPTTKKTLEAHDAYRANRKEAGRVIDIETCEYTCLYARLLRPLLYLPSG